MLQTLAWVTTLVFPRVMLMINSLQSNLCGLRQVPQTGILQAMQISRTLVWKDFYED